MNLLKTSVSSVLATGRDSIPSKRPLGRATRPTLLHAVEVGDPMELLQQARNGHGGAVTALYQRYLPFVHKICRRFFLPGASHEDLLQEGALGLHHAIATFNSLRGQRFDDYVSMCVRNHVVHAVRHATRQKHMLLTRAACIEGTVEVETYSSGGPGPEEEVVAELSLQDWKELMRRCLSELEQAVLEARLHDQDGAEVARRLGLGRKQLENALFRARRKLAQAALQADLLEGTLSRACRRPSFPEDDTPFAA